MQSDTVDRFIQQYINKLRDAGVSGIDQYELRLRNNAKTSVLYDLFFEGRAALMFQQNGFHVTLRESPDLRLELDKEVVYAEVKHFKEKEQDKIDEQNMSEAVDELVLIGDLTATEGIPAWKQITDVAIGKVDQYIDKYPNILVIESSSDSLELMADTAVHEYEVVVCKCNDPRLLRLNAIMLVNTGLTFFGSKGPHNVEFCPISKAAIPLSESLTRAFTSIRWDRMML
jgi:hypothetical protein